MSMGDGLHVVECTCPLCGVRADGSPVAVESERRALRGSTVGGRGHAWVQVLGGGHSGHLLHL